MELTGLKGDGCGEQINPPDFNKTFKINMAEITVFNRDIYNLVQDLEIIIGMAKHLPRQNQRVYQALFTANHAVNICSDRKEDSVKTALQVTKAFLAEKNGGSQHTIHAMGHCHIDCAWLWRYDCTIRKCARSWSSTLLLMEQYPDVTFTCSQAQQHQWVKDKYPQLYKKIREAIKSGKFIPVGGSWVEMDGNLPSGESFARQFLYGQRFYQEEFGRKCTEFWLPDTFGYTAQLPQMVKSAGMTRFVTQKLSWNAVNKFPHHTFIWEGIDGTEILSHFPPGNNYHMLGHVHEVVMTVNNFEDKGRSNSSMYLYGYGDGGGGITENQIERIHRMSDVDGLPRMVMSSPAKYFEYVEQNEKDNLCRWTGELFLEFHQGTYTSQAKTKLANRRCEQLLHDVEFLSCISLLESSTFRYPKEKLNSIWKNVLLNQFHDVLPGSSIQAVYDDAMKIYKESIENLNWLKVDVIKHIEKVLLKPENTSTVRRVFNKYCWERTEVIPIEKNDKLSNNGTVQEIKNGTSLVSVSVPANGYIDLINTNTIKNPVSVRKDGDHFILENGIIKAQILKNGNVKSIMFKKNSRETIKTDCVGNQFVLYDDVPNKWDAWDVNHFHLETRTVLNNVQEEACISERGPLQASIEFQIGISQNSTIKQVISLDADSPYLKFSTTINWYENRKFLKVEFPVNVRSDEAAYDIPFGFIKRTTRPNTSWDWSKFEVCGHKWADLSEYDWGVAIINDCKYGHMIQHDVICLSLLKAAKQPDPEADMGTQTFSYAVMPHTGSFQSALVQQIACNFNNPVTATMTTGCPSSKTYMEISPSGIILETIKMGEDDMKSIVLRMFQSYGGRTETSLKFNFKVKTAFRCNILEEKEEKLDIRQNRISIFVKPFEIVTLLLHF
ncbi:alpha-mannosidase 2C1-like [Mytilus californianus]|uniref:alpha-mannosidase 2C1-like n=1 Tax=Mytilus californianus TaxID=6549 RepID=UPI002246E191|nr:alpha-mannosidase 2C1-like [Mytilus californianus]